MSRRTCHNITTAHAQPCLRLRRKSPTLSHNHHRLPDQPPLNNELAINCLTDSGLRDRASTLPAGAAARQQNQPALAESTQRASALNIRETVVIALWQCERQSHGAPAPPLNRQVSPDHTALPPPHLLSHVRPGRPGCLRSGPRTRRNSAEGGQAATCDGRPCAGYLRKSPSKPCRRRRRRRRHHRLALDDGPGQLRGWLAPGRVARARACKPGLISRCASAAV